MKHRNELLLEKFFKAFNENDLTQLEEVLAENVKWHIPGDHPLSGTKVGVKQIMEYFGKLKKGKFKAEPIVMGVNENYVIDCHRNWSNFDDGNNLVNYSCLLWKIQEGRIIEVINFPQDQAIVNDFFNKRFKIQ